MKTYLVLFTALQFLFIGNVLAEPVQTFDMAKTRLLNDVYYDNPKTLYCGCTFERRGRNGGTVDHDSCGYEVDGRRGDSQTRAGRIEFEHIVPISFIARGRPCGNRSQCTASDALYRQIKADPHNLSPAVGEVNALRSNYSFAELPHISFEDSSFGACNFKFDQRTRSVEPADNVKGFIARTYFYVSHAYGVALTQSEQALFMRWDQLYPVTQWELTRANRIAAIQGWTNPYITGERSWGGYKTEFTAATGMYGDGRYTVTYSSSDDTNRGPAYIGNKNSGIYFPRSCHWYDRVGASNRVPFDSARAAQEAGFRAARNC